MGNMTEGQLKARKKWILGNKKMKRGPGSNHSFWMHLRGYHKGDIRCCKCDKWINPENPFEAIEIKITPAGKRLHDPRYCGTYRAFGIAAFSTVPRTSPCRKRRVDEAFRY